MELLGGADRTHLVTPLGRRLELAGVPTEPLSHNGAGHPLPFDPGEVVEM